MTFADDRDFVANMWTKIDLKSSKYYRRGPIEGHETNGEHLRLGNLVSYKNLIFQNKVIWLSYLNIPIGVKFMKPECENIHIQPLLDNCRQLYFTS